MQLNRRNLVTVAASVLCLGLLMPSPAQAYPQFQLATGNTRCNQCHFAPAGGGLISGYGRDESEGTLSTTAGSSGFAHGLVELPEWLALGADLRFASVLKGGADTHPQVFLFPMQTDLYSRFGIGDAWSVVFTAGMRGAARGSTDSLGLRFLSREHFVMWQPEETGWYARAGRFFAPYGLRLQDHTAYVRRYSGQHTLEETYNVSFGKIEDEWELHATVFTPPSTFGIPAFSLFGDVGAPATGAAVYYERRAREETAAYGVQSKVELGDENTRFWLGGVGKLWLESASLLFLSQLDVGAQTFAFDDVDPQLMLLAHLSATYYLHQGVMIGAAIERYDPHLMLAGSARDSVSLNVQWLFRSHWEVMAMGKLDMQQDFGSAIPTGMLMLHYYL